MEFVWKDTGAKLPLKLNHFKGAHYRTDPRTLAEHFGAVHVLFSSAFLWQSVIDSVTYLSIPVINSFVYFIYLFLLKMTG